MNDNAHWRQRLLLRITTEGLRVTATVVLLCTVIFTGCSKNPATGRSQLNFISEGQEISMGRDADKQIVASLGLYPDSSLQRYVNRLGVEMAENSERPGLPWEFKVVDDPQVNAFALPGGYIYVTRGLMYHVENEAELTGVIGHEIGHVTAKHSVNRLSKQQLAQIGLIAGVLIEPELQRYAQLASTGLSLLFLKFSRDDEREADDLGLRYMRSAGNDPRELVGVFEMLDRVSKAAGGGRLPEWLATHPNPGNRRERIAKQLGELEVDPQRVTVNREAYLARIDGLVYGQDPREGFFRGNVFHHPGLAFRLQFPGGWQYSNQKQGVLAVNPNQDAVIQVTLSQARSADEAARDFFSQQGLEYERIQRGSINNMHSASARFAAQTEQGPIYGLASFIEHGNNVFQIVGYGTQSWNRYENSVVAAVRSFARETDSRILNARPQRIDIVELDRSMTIDQFYQRYNSAAPVQAVALINQVDTGSRLVAGQKVKRIVGEQFQFSETE